ncbi:LPD7 domain-containing protein [Paraburkholderia largidicola]|uniref:Large polyvalent protein-associated domain-containing protein n=1 Tax=Paraburkholderia largidicola TaxID=3014751 RepID=A0A7I8C2W5_9BURK|nr:LPD7 domain-containing protein [Paraburkholderia sp. PGU16]BCF95384.1 hypothetical protein PPGU16_84510 [Paraburkholderia sp. PGU16]
MLIRVRGYHAGIKDYLEDGQKKDRDMQRDEMDERVMLAGDLQLTHDIIESIDTDAERYLTVTLSFKEDYVAPEVLQDIVREFERFAFAAYEPSEYVMYAEAHLPKIKAYTNRKNGEPVERKPHVHIVIPATNLLSGTRLEPFGLVDTNTKFIDAFQEHINHKYGLASPKDNRRVEFTDASEMISRYKGDVFEGSNSDAKARILEAVMSRDIRSYDDFKTVLAEFGETRTRNAGKPGEYENVKLDGAPRGINLKEYVFSREFVELTADQKNEALNARYKPQYDAAGDPQATPAPLLALIQEWENVRSKEVKYLNGAFRARYREMSAEEQQQVLAERESRFYQRYDNEGINDASSRRIDFGMGRTYGGRGRGTSRVYEPGRHTVEPEQAREAERTAAAGLDLDHEYDLDADRRGTPAESRDGMRDLQGIGLDGEHARSQVLLPDLAPYQLGNDRSSAVDALRWRSAGRGRSGSTEPAGRGLGSHWRYELAVEYERYAQSTATEQRAMNAATAAKLSRSYDRLKGGGKLPPGFDRRSRPESLHRTPRLSDTPSLHPRSDVPAPSRARRSKMSRAQSDRLAAEFEVGKGGARSRRGRPPALRDEVSLPSTWQRPRRARNTATGRAADTMLDQLERNLHEQRQQRAAGPRSEFQEIRQQLDASRLLASLAHSHGVLIDKYSITRGRDGSDRIRAGNRNLNVSDFLTKEMNLPWSEASRILRDTYHEQMRNDPDYLARQTPQKLFWREYQEHRNQQLVDFRNRWLDQGASERARKSSIRDVFTRQRSQIIDNPALSAADKKAALSVARMQRIEQEAALREAIAIERDALKASTRYRIDDHYREFLAERAQAGDERALHELRRVQRVGRRVDPAPAARIEPVQPQQPNAIIYRGTSVTHDVHQNGDVTYRQDGKAVLDDEGHSLRMWEADDTAIELGLMLAQKKFGNVLELKGPEDFRHAAARVAAQRNMRIEFSEPELNDVMRGHRAMLDAQEQERNERERAREQAIRKIARDALRPQQDGQTRDIEPGPEPDPDPGIER